MTEEARLRRLAELYRELAELGDVADKEAHLELSEKHKKQADEAAA